MRKNKKSCRQYINKINLKQYIQLYVSTKTDVCKQKPAVLSNCISLERYIRWKIKEKPILFCKLLQKNHSTLGLKMEDSVFQSLTQNTVKDKCVASPFSGKNIFTISLKECFFLVIRDVNTKNISFCQCLLFSRSLLTHFCLNKP